MKKRLLSLGIGLGLTVALLLSCAACSQLTDSNVEFLPCKMLYWEISKSADTETGDLERIFSMDELQNNVEYLRNSAPFAQIDEDFFAEKSLLIYRYEVPYSGGHAYVNAYTKDKGKSITVRALYDCGTDPDAGNVLMLAELDRKNYTKIGVEVEFSHDEFDDNKVLIYLTEEATNATVFEDYTVEDFPEINAESIREITDTLTATIRQHLREDPTGSTIPDYWKNYKRCFSITLKEKSKENVLRVVNLLRQRDDIKSASPNYCDKGDA